MITYVCPGCGRLHTVKEFIEDRFCRRCGRFLTRRDRRTTRTKDEREIASTPRTAKVAGVTEYEEGFMKLFPYSPYPQQIEFMKDAERVLSNRGVLIAEACNGFGKTVCTLAVTLSIGRRIIYATRTHEQVRQVLREIERINRKTRKEFSAVSLASRQNLCLNEVCRRLPPFEAVEACNILRKTGRCPYRSDFKSKLLNSSLPPVLSIRSLLRIGRSRNLCPYFLARRIAEDSIVVVAPYQYIFNEAVRIRVKLDLNGKILVFDEAHNADKVGQEALSDILSERGLNNARRELQLVDVPSTFIDDLREYLTDNVQSEPVVKPGVELRRDLERLLEEDLERFVNSFRPVVDEIRTFKIKQNAFPICYLNGVLNFLSLVGSGRSESYAAIYRKSPTGLSLVEYRCLDPSLALKPVIEEAYAALIMSGTLSPLSLFKEVIGLPDAETRTYSAIAKAENVRTFIDISVTTRFKERSSEMLKRYGERVLNLIPKVPNGVLIFFPQRGFMKEALENWVRNGFVEKRDGKMFFGGKEIFIEGERASENAKVVDEYKNAARSSGAVLFAVFRGRNAEGSDFPYKEARGIFLVGLPYADYRDPVVKAQIRYFNSRSPRLGERWYLMDAFRAANQAIGRGIRHIDDWCNFFLMDKRYSSYWRFISRWATENGIERIP